jgi:predicted Zn-dependent peptidase
MVLREQLGLTYGAGAFHNGSATTAGPSTPAAAPRPRARPSSLEALLDLLRQPGKEAVDAVELRRLLSKISGEFALEVEGIDTVAMKTVQQRLFGLAPDFWERYRSEVESISAESCSRPAAACWSTRPCSSWWSGAPTS